MTTPSTSPETGSLSISDAAAQIKQMLAPKPDNKPAGDDQSANAETETTDEVDAAEATADDTADTDETDASDDANAEDEADADAEETDEGSGEEEEQQAPQRFKVKVAGEEVEVELDELLSGYSRTQDYTRKTQQHAAVVKEHAAEFEAVQRERAAYAQLLPALAAQLQSSAPKAPDPNLRALDPGEYAAQVADYNAHQQRLQAAQAEQQRLEQEQTNELNKRRQAVMKKQAELLPVFIPQWSDPALAAKERAEIRAYAKEALQLSDEDIAQAGSSAAAVTALRKAMLYDRLVAKGKAKPAAQPAPKGVNQPGAAKPQGQGRKASEFTRARQRLAKTGSISDATAAIKHLLAG